MAEMEELQSKARPKHEVKADHSKPIIPVKSTFRLKTSRLLLNLNQLSFFVILQILFLQPQHQLSDVSSRRGSQASKLLPVFSGAVYFLSKPQRAFYFDQDFENNTKFKIIEQSHDQDFPDT